MSSDSLNYPIEHVPDSEGTGGLAYHLYSEKLFLSLPELLEIF